MPLKIKQQVNVAKPRYWLELKFNHGKGLAYTVEEIPFDSEEALENAFLTYEYLSQGERARTFEALSEVILNKPWIMFDIMPNMSEEEFQGAFDNELEWTPADILTGWVELPNDACWEYNFASIHYVKMYGIIDGIRVEYEVSGCS
jgi:hypothetical protein